MRKLLEKILVLQSKEVIKEYPNPRLAKQRITLKRMNPWNPISYLVIIVGLLLALLMFGFVGIKDQVDFKNPFKWQ